MRTKELTKSLFRLNNALGNLLFAGLLILLVASSCTKEPISGWSFYASEPPPPRIESLNAVIKNCVPPYPVTFYQQTGNLIGEMQYHWNFGDGNTSVKQNPNHIYDSVGNYTIQLIVSNKIGSDTAYLYIPDLNKTSLPVETAFSFSHFNNNQYAPNKVIFSNHTSGANQFDWDFGDGNESTDANPTHIFSQAGTYTVELIGTCTNGTQDQTTRDVFIQATPTKVFIDSINLMLPSTYRNKQIFIDVWHGNIRVGETAVITPRDFPVKFRRNIHFAGSLFFDEVQFGSNEPFKFFITHDHGDGSATILKEIILASSNLQANFYPTFYPKVETFPAEKDVFIDLYLSYGI